MREILCNWRRTLGWPLLAVTCVLAILWIRSRTTVDQIRFVTGNRHHRISSTREYGLAWESWNHSSKSSWDDEVADHTGRDGVIVYRRVNHQELLVKEQSHGALVVPLAYLSAYLLLCRPRKRLESPHSQVSFSAQTSH